MVNFYTKLKLYATNDQEVKVMPLGNSVFIRQRGNPNRGFGSDGFS